MRKLFVIAFSFLFVPSVYAAQQPQQQSKSSSIFGRANAQIEQYEQQMGDKSPELITRPKAVFGGSRRNPFVSVIVKKDDGVVSSNANDSDNAAKTALESLTIQGLIWGGKFSQAIVNNKVYKVGDSVQGLIITSIDKGGITFSSGGKKYILNATAGPAVKRQ